MKIQDITFSRDIRTAMRAFPALEPYGDSISEVVIVEDEECERHCALGYTSGEVPESAPYDFYVNHETFSEDELEALDKARSAALKARLAFR